MKQYYHQIRNQILKPTNESKIYLIFNVLLLLTISYPIIELELNLSPITLEIYVVFIIISGILLPEKPSVNLLLVGALTILFTVLVIHEHISLLKSIYYPWRVLFKGIFFGILLAIFIKEMIYEIISLKVLFQSVAGYLLIGLIFAQIFKFVHAHSENAFNFSSDNEFNHIYLSIITLTSLGFGDLVPTNMVTQSLIMMEGIIGQLYLAFFASIMIGKYMNQRYGIKQN